MKRIVVTVILILLCTSIKVMAIADSADSACVINAVTGETVFAKNIDKRRPMASTTKIMTAIIAIEKCKMDEVVSVSAIAGRQEGSAAYIYEGDSIYMKDILYGLMLNSGNDAALAIAEHIGGSAEVFAEMMNEKAKEIGMDDTHFMNPSGLDDPEHYTTARDLAKLAQYAMNNKEFREIVSSKKYQAKLVNSDKTLYFSNHNKLLTLYEGATGIKTGYTRKTGRCLVSSAERDGMKFIAVTLGAPDDWKDHSQMLDYAFSGHYPQKAVEKGSRVKIADLNNEQYSFLAADDFVVPMKKNSGQNIDVVRHVAKDLSAPVNAGEKVGYIEIIYNGNTLGTIDIISEKDIFGHDKILMKNSFFDTTASFFKRALCF